MIQLFAQFAFVDDVRQPNAVAAIDQRKFNIGIGFVAENGLAHQQLVKIGVDQRPDNRVDLPFVVMHPCRDINHGGVPQYAFGAKSHATAQTSSNKMRANAGSQGGACHGFTQKVVQTRCKTGITVFAKRIRRQRDHWATG